MKHALASLVAVLLSLSGQSWAADTLPLSLPSQTSLKLAKLQKREHIASFHGTAEIAGRLVAQWVPKVDETKPTQQEFRIYVDERVARTLPAFEGYPVQKIDIENGREALRKSVSPQAFADFVRKKTLIVETTAVFRIKSYVVGVECDAQWARAVVTDVIHPELLASAGDPTRFGC
jgi:hypothetical protein